MVNQDSFTPQEYAKMVGMFPDPPQNPLPTGGYMDAGFDWVVHQAEAFEARGNMNVPLQKRGDYHYNCPYCKERLTIMGDGRGSIVAICENENKRCHGLEIPRQYLENFEEWNWYHNERKSAETFGAESTYEYVMGMIEDLSDDDYMDFCYEMDIDPEDMEELSSFVMRNYDSNRVMRFLKDRGMVEGYQAEAQPISDEGELLVVRNDMGQTKGFIEMEEDLEDDSIEMEISDDEMEEIAEITLDAEFSAQGKQYPFVQDFGDLYVLDKTDKGEYVVRTRGGNVVAELSPVYSQVDESFAKRVVDDLNGHAEQRTADILNFVGHKTQAGYAQDIGFNRAETTMTVEHKDGHRYSETDPVHGERGEIIGHVSEITEEKETPYQKIYDTEYEVSIERKMIQHLDGVDIEADSQKELKEKAKEIGYERSDDFVNTKVVGGMDGYSIAHQDLVKESDFVKPSRDWFSLALGTAAVVIGGSLFLQNRGVFKADGNGTETAPSLVAHPSTGDLLPADYEEMVVESTGYAVPVIPVSLDPSFMGSRFHALPTDRVVESNEPGIGAHTDVAMTRDTNYREPEQTMVTEPPFAYKFNAENGCKCSLLDRIKSFFTGKSCCEVKEANSITGQTPYFGVGFEPKNPQTRVIKETRPISLDPSTAPYLPTNLSGYTGQSYTPPSVYSDMMQIGVTGQTPSFVSSQSSIGENRAGSRPVATSDSLQSVHGNLSAGVNQSYTDGSKTMSLSQWSIEYDVSQISDSEAFAVSRSSGERTMIRRV